jgi:hypothetical protein
MGNSSSQSVSDYITNSSTYTQTVSTTLKLGNKATMNTTNVNNVTFGNGGAGCCEFKDAKGNPILDKEGKAQYLPGCSATSATINCGKNGIIFDQNEKSNQIAIQSIDSKFSQQLSTQLQNAAKADVANALKQLQQNDISSLFNKTAQDVETDVTNTINTTLNNDTMIKIVNSAVVNSFNVNKNEFINCGVISGEQCNFTQNASSKAVIQNTLSSVGQLVQNNKQLNDFYTKVNNELTNKQQGEVGTIADVFNNLFKSMGKLGLIFLVIGILVVFVILIVIVMLVLRGRRKQSIVVAP